MSTFHGHWLPLAWPLGSPSGRDSDPVLSGLHDGGVPFAALPIGQALRSNVTLTEPDGVTTKINEPGPELSGEQQEA